MSAGAWIRRQRDRSLSEHERRKALAMTTAALIAAALGFANSRPAHSTQTHTSAKTAATAAIDPSEHAPRPSGDEALSPTAAAASRSFLAGYLAYTSGKTRASRIADATGALLTVLASHPPRPSPAMRSQHSRIVELHSTSAPAGEVGVSATVNDGGVVDYTLKLILTPQHGPLRVSALEQS